MTPHQAVWHKDIRLLQETLTIYSTDSQDRFGSTPLMIAIGLMDMTSDARKTRRARREIVDYLLAQGASPDILDVDGRKVEDYASTDHTRAMLKAYRARRKIAEHVFDRNRWKEDTRFGSW